jgi:hypothetical protein
MRNVFETIATRVVMRGGEGRWGCGCVYGRVWRGRWSGLGIGAFWHLYAALYYQRDSGCYFCTAKWSPDSSSLISSGLEHGICLHGFSSPFTFTALLLTVILTHSIFVFIAFIVSCFSSSQCEFTPRFIFTVPSPHHVVIIMILFALHYLM